jgi:predicted aspartyl protease
MNRIHHVIGLALLALAAPVAAQTSTAHYETVGQPDQVDQTTQAEALKFKRDLYERMTIPVRVAGSGPYRFLIDTGADRTAISRQLARRLRLVNGASATLHSVAGMSEVGTATVPVLDLPTKKVTNVDAALLEAENMGADGILGLDSLHSQRILFDFKHQTLTIVPSQARLPEDDEGTVIVTGRMRNGRLILTNAKANNTHLTLVVDTGAQVSIGNSALRRKLTRGRNLKNSGQIELISVTGEKLLGQYMVVGELEVGGVSLKNLPVVFADSHAFGQIGLQNRPALLLGMNALRGFEKVSIDFARKKLRVVLPEEGRLDGPMFALR